MPFEAAGPVILEQKLIGQKRFLRFYVPNSHLRGNDGGVFRIVQFIIFNHSMG